jgi:hypothetical protein
MVSVPATLRDLIAGLAPEQIDVVAELSTRDGLIHSLQLIRPDLVVIGLLPAEGDAAVRAWLDDFPETKFIALSADGRAVVGLEHRAEPIPLMHRSPQGLIDFLRGRSTRSKSSAQIRSKPRDRSFFHPAIDG